MKLYATPLSHFSRKVRILLDYYQCPYEIIDVGNVADSDLKGFGGNPLLKVPVLMDNENWILDSDHIAEYLVLKLDPSDRFQIQTKKIFDLNARAIMNGVMSEEVKILLAKRSLLPVENYPFFDKALKSIHNGLNWLEENYEEFEVTSPKYRDFHLVCMWDHLKYYKLIDLKYSRLEQIVSGLASHSFIKKSAP